MGDRGNIKIVQHGKDASPLYLYTHWDGHGLPQTLQDALRKHWRWDDEPYLARIIFEAVVQKPGTETGYGISTYIIDNQHPILVVDCERQEVYIEEEDETRHRGVWTFHAYCALDLAGHDIREEE